MRLLFLYILLGPFVNWTAHSQSFNSSLNRKLKDPQSAYKAILKIDYFALGGVGFAGQTSEGENAFKILLSSKHATKYFELVLSKKNIPAKLYALCGLREIDSTLFLQKLSMFTDTTLQVATMRGCISDEERFTDIVLEIKTGLYDVFIHRHAP